MKYIILWLCYTGSLWGLFWSLTEHVFTAKKTTNPAPNVLFIAVDDLNHWVGYAGRNKLAKTPNIDRLSRMGMSFTNAHCAAPLCCPSRAALMSGLRPSTTGVYTNGDDWRKVIPDSITLPSFFRKKGYWVAGGGKLYHGGFDRDSEFDYYYRNAKDRANQGVVKRGQFGGIRWAQMDAGDDALADYHVAQWAGSELLKKHDRPFFLACGIFRPHMPWNVPKKYYDMYPLEQIQLPSYLKDDLLDVPLPGQKIADNGDHKALLKTNNPEQTWKEAIQAYLACITYADAQIGRVLDALENGPNRQNTIVVLWGDHGWHLGEKDHWRKFSLWEEATRAPLIWYVPGMTKADSRCARTVDFMSIYPTLAELCGFESPAHLEGKSIVSLLKNPQAKWNSPAICTFNYNNHAVRTEQWRYIRYNQGEEELYDEKKDPYEWKNLAKAARSAKVKTQLQQWLPKVNNNQKVGNDGGATEN